MKRIAILAAPIACTPKVAAREATVERSQPVWWRRVKSRLIVCLALFVAASAMAGEAPLPAGHERAIVVLERSVKDGGKRVAKQVETLGGKLETDLGDRLIITGPPSVIGSLRSHEAVRYVQTTAADLAPGAAEPRRASARAATHAPAANAEPWTWTSGKYSYDGAGNIKGIGTSAEPGTHGHRAYGYDAMARLTKAEIGGVTPERTYGYGYDSYGNRNQVAVDEQWTTVGVDSASNRFTDAGYDSSGNQTSRGATSAAYDGFGMLTFYGFDGTNSETAVYTPNDERIGVLRGTDWTWSLRDPAGKVLRQYRSSSTQPEAPWLWVEDFVHRGGLLLGSERVAEQGGRRHYHLDHLGSARLVTTTAGALISEHDYLPFGEERTPVDQHVSRGYDREQPLRFTGHERDFDIATPNDSSGYVDYMHARYYAAEAGRFLSMDPGRDWDTKQPQSWNMYTYVRGNPISLVDPTGRETDDLEELRQMENPMIAKLGIEAKFGNDEAGVKVGGNYDLVKDEANISETANIGAFKLGGSATINLEGESSGGFHGGMGPFSGGVNADGSGTFGAGGSHGDVKLTLDKNGTPNIGTSFSYGIATVTIKSNEVSLGVLGSSLGIKPLTLMRITAAIESVTRPIESVFPATGSAHRVAGATRGAGDFLRRLCPWCS